jgi:hypothetical protein
VKRIYVSSVYRSEEDRPSATEGVSLFIIDWDTGEVLASPEKLGPEYTTAVRGLSRSNGTRGLAWFKDKLWVAGASHGLFSLDPDTYTLTGTFGDRPKNAPEIKHPHQIKVKDDLLYVTNTGKDSLIKFDGEKIVETINIADMPGVPELIEPYIDAAKRGRPWGTDKVHFNSISWDAEGNEYHTYMFCRAIFDVTNLKVIEQGLSCPHDLEARGDQLFYTSSNDRSLFSIRIGTSLDELRRTCWMKKEIPEHELEARKNHDAEIFPYTALVRGVAFSPDGGLLFTCHAPGNLVCLDIRQHGRQVGGVKYCNSRHEQPFDILLDPRDWA